MICGLQHDDAVNMRAGLSQRTIQDVFKAFLQGYLHPCYSPLPSLSGDDPDGARRLRVGEQGPDDGIYLSQKERAKYSMPCGMCLTIASTG